MNIDNYFEEIKKSIDKYSWLIESKMINYRSDQIAGTGIIEGKVKFLDGSDLNFVEVVSMIGRKYRYHYMDKNKKMVSRWDSAPHYRGIKTFPYHKHTEKGVEGSKEILISGVIKVIKNIVLNSL